MEKITKALHATLEFLEKNTKLDMKTYQTIESAQVKILIQQFSQTTCEIQEWSPLVDLVQSSEFLSSWAKAELVTAMSTVMGKRKQVKRVIQSLQVGFLNYLTKEDREHLANDDQHAFARLTVVVRRCMDIGLVFPCEQTMGHVIACITEFYNLAEDPRDKHNLLLEFKRQLKSARANFIDEVPIQEYPPDPRQLPETLRKQFYSDEVWGQMPGAVLARCKPGKWLRLSSKELTNRAGQSQGQQSDMMGGMQQMMQMQMQMFQVMMHGKRPNQDLLDNFQVFPQKRRKSLEPASSQHQQGCNQLALQDGNVRNNDDAEEAEPNSQGRSTPDQKQQVSNVPAFSLPDFNGDQKNTVGPKEHHQAMLQAFEERKAAREADPPKAKAKGKAKAKAKPAAKFMAKPAAAVKTSKPKAKAKPAMIVKGGPTLYYGMGKIHRSDTSECWRVFKNKGDRVDLKVKWHGNPAVAWAKALQIIDDAAK